VGGPEAVEKAVPEALEFSVGKSEEYHTYSGYCKARERVAVVSYDAGYQNTMRGDCGMSAGGDIELDVHCPALDRQ